RLEVMTCERQRRRHDHHRHILGEGLCDAREGILDARPGLRGEDTVALAAADARVPIRDSDADALLPAQNGADIERGARLDQRIARVAGEKARAFALENLGDQSSAVHGVSSIPHWPHFDRRNTLPCQLTSTDALP